MGILDKNGSLSKENFLTFLEHFQEDFPKIRNVKKLENIFLFIYAWTNVEEIDLGKQHWTKYLDNSRLFVIMKLAFQNYYADINQLHHVSNEAHDHANKRRRALSDEIKCRMIASPKNFLGSWWKFVPNKGTFLQKSWIWHHFFDPGPGSKLTGPSKFHKNLPYFGGKQS